MRFAIHHGIRTRPLAPGARGSTTSIRRKAMEPSPKAVLDLAGNICKASQDRKRWADVLKGLAELTRSRSSALVYRNLENPQADLTVVHGVAPDAERAYHEYYRRLDPLYRLSAEAVPLGAAWADHSWRLPDPSWNASAASSTPSSWSPTTTTTSLAYTCSGTTPVPPPSPSTGGAAKGPGPRTSWISSRSSPRTSSALSPP